MAVIVSDVLHYVWQMLPMCLLALIVFLLLRPQRIRRLERRGLISGRAREAALCLFILYCAGLAALTLFPANLWVYVMTLGRAYPEDVTLMSFYPDWGADSIGNSLFAGYTDSLSGNSACAALHELLAAVYAAGEYYNVRAGGLFSSAAVAKGQVVEVAAGRLLQLLHH